MGNHGVDAIHMPRLYRIETKRPHPRTVARNSPPTRWILPAGWQLLASTRLGKPGYAELETIGLVKTGRGAGTIVASSSNVTPADRETQLDGLVFALIHRARLLGLSDADIEDAVASRLRGHERHD